MIEEFKKFALRGNVVDLAIGVMIGAAFGAIALGLVANVIYFAGIPSIYQEFFKGIVICLALSFTFIVGRRKTA